MAGRENHFSTRDFQLHQAGLDESDLFMNAGVLTMRRVITRVQDTATFDFVRACQFQA